MKGQIFLVAVMYQDEDWGTSKTWFPSRALCRIKLLPVTHVLVDMWMLTVKPVHKL